jgi:hypothetical protein
MYSPGPSIATISNIGYYFYVENVGHTDQNYLKKLCFVATVSKKLADWKQKAKRFLRAGSSSGKSHDSGPPPKGGG